MDEVHCVCFNRFCAANFASSERNRGGRYATADGMHEIDYERTVFRGIDPKSSKAIITNHHIIRNSSMECDMCKRPVSVRICPYCHSEIPPGAEESGNKIFVVLGPKGVGKSHYIGVLINRLSNTVANEFGAVFNPAGDSTIDRYREIYGNPLFTAKRKLPSTAPYDASEDSREPLIYYLNMKSGDRQIVHTFAFIDTAGEDLEGTDRAAETNLDNLIANASGIVYLVDPLQIKYIRDRIHMDDLPPIRGSASETLTMISNIIRGKREGLNPNARIDIPLAVALTKCDLLLKPAKNDEEDLIFLSPGSAVRIPRETGSFDKENFDQIDAEIEEYLRRTAGEEFIQIVNGFADHCYFAVSALGNNPEGEELLRGVMPMRVEDPFIWLLNRKGME